MTLSKHVVRFFVVLLVLMAVGLVITPTAFAASNDNNIEWGGIGHDSRDPLYRSPTGAVVTGTPIRLRLKAYDGDLTGVSVRVWDDRLDTETFYPMSLVASNVLFNGDANPYEFWEVTLPASANPTVYWYRFILTDGSDTDYYEDDSAATGGWGQVYDTSPDISWQLTIYDAGFTTPDWVKDAVIYQIFPDRFRDGNSGNNPAAAEFFYGNYDTIVRSNTTDWNAPICDPRAEAGSSFVCSGIWAQNFYGGDLQGIIDQLSYIDSLGVTAIYLNPIFESPSNHKYDTTDFFHIDDNFGDLATFQTLVTQANALGINIILDGVFNHSSSDSVYFDRYSRWTGTSSPSAFPTSTTVGVDDDSGACESLIAGYTDWYTFFTYTGTPPAPCSDNRDYPKWFGIFDSLPVYQHDNIEVRDYFINNGTASVAPYWIDQGAAGWRLDVAPEIDHGQLNDTSDDYWEDFRAALHAIDPDAYVVGEEWGNPTSWTIGGEWDATMNYQFSAAILSYWRDTTFTDNDFNSGSSAGQLVPLAPSAVNERLLNLEERYAEPAFQTMMNLFGSHDTNRVMFLLDHNAGSNNTFLYNDPNYDWSDSITRLKGAALMQMTLPGAPTIYYGDEIGLVGPMAYDSGGGYWQDDPYNRQPYPWLDESGTPFYAHLQSVPTRNDLFSYYQTLTTTRHNNEALRTGSFDPLLTDDGNDVYAYGRQLADDSNSAVIVVNGTGTAQPATVDVSGYLPVGANVTDALTSTVYTVNGSGQIVIGSLPARGGVVLTANSFTTRPLCVTDLVATPSGAQIDLSWSATTNATSYDVYRSRLSGGGYDFITNIAGTSYSDAAVSGGLPYYYLLVAKNDTTLLTNDFFCGNETVAAILPPIDWHVLQWPPTITMDVDGTTTVDVYGQVYMAGFTDAQSTPVVGITAEVGYGATSSTPDDTWTWYPMSPSGMYDFTQNNDEHVGSMLPTEVGTFWYTTRWSNDNGATWRYSQLNPPGGDYTSGNVGVMTIGCANYSFPYTLGTLVSSDLAIDLRNAVNCANANGTSDTIDLNGQTVTFTDSFADYAASATALPSITTTITLQNGAITRSGATEFRFLYVGSPGDLTLDALDVSNGGGASYIYGGAVYGASGSILIIDSTFTNNSVSLLGGAVRNFGADIDILNSEFRGNSAQSGGFLATNARVDIVNSLISGNLATQSGGGIYNNDTKIYVTNTTISGNQNGVTYRGGGLFATGTNARSIVRNTIIYGNEDANGSAHDIYGLGGGIINVAYSNYGAQTGVTDNGNNLTIDPLFAIPTDASNAPTTSGDYTLQNKSPLVGAGNNTEDPDDGGTLPIMSDLSWTDLNGNTRIVNGLIDMGAYEEQTCASIAFPYTLPDNNPATLRTAIICANTNGTDDTIDLNGQTVTFADGPYNPTSTFGPFEAPTALPAIVTNITLQNGTLDNSSSDYRFLFVDASATLILDTVTVQNAVQGTALGDVGAAVFIDQSGSLVVTNSTITNNSAYHGGGIFNHGGTLTIAGSNFTNNVADNNGGAVIVDAGVTTIRESIFQANTAISGGAILNSGASSTMYIVNTLVSGNKATFSASGIFNGFGSDMTITNSTVAGNSGPAGSGGIRTDNAGTTTIVNTIAYGNDTRDITNSGGTAPVVSYSTYGVANGITDGGNNSTSDPLFVSPIAAASAPITGGDYTLQSSSPALDAGNNSADPDGGGSLPIMSDNSWTDLNGDARISLGTIDMGAYEGAACLSYTFPYTLGTVQANLVDDLRQAIECANANGTDDTIDLDGQTVTFTDSFADYAGATALPSITTTITLQNGTLERDSGGINQFRMAWVPNGGTLTLASVTVQHFGGASYPITGGGIDGGGAILVGSSSEYGGTLDLIDSVLQYNQSVWFGGSILSRGGAITIDNTRFSFNTAGDKLGTYGFYYGNGGAILAFSASLTVTDSIFEGNAAIVTATNGLGRGGAIMMRYASSPANISNSLFIGNYAGLWGASGNAPVGTSYGGAIHAWDNATFTLTNNTFANNYANQGGGAISVENATVNLNNSIAYSNWDEASNEDLLVLSGTLTATNSLYGVASGVVTDGGGNVVGSDPQFINPTGDTSGNYRVQVGSPVIDTGNDTLANNAGLTLDIEGNNRFVDGDMANSNEVDMGAYEFQGSATISGTITDDQGGQMEGVDVYAYIAGTSTLLNQTCTDNNGDYSLEISHVGAADVKAGGILSSQTSCTHATDFYNQTMLATGVIYGGSYTINLALIPNQVPIATSPTAPTGLQTTQTPQFDWDARQGANAYQILIEEIAGSYTDTLTVTEDSSCAGAATCSYTPVGGEEIPYSLGNFRAFVRSANSVGNSAYGSPVYFQMSPAVSAPTVTPTINAPASASVTSLTPTLEWTAVADASHYQLYIYYGTGGNSVMTIAAVDANCTSTCSTVVAVTEGNNGFRVRGANVVGSTAWSAARGFTATGASGVPSDVVLTSPTGTVATTTTTVEWQYEQYVDRYALYIIPPGVASSHFENNPAGTYCPVLTPGATCSANISTPASGTYNVQITARNAYGYGNWNSNPIVVDLAPDSILSAPTWLSDSIVRTDRSFPLAWSEVEGAISYTLVMYNPLGVSDAQVFNSSVCAAGICTVIYEVDTNGLYAAYVRATGISSESPFALSSFPVRLLDAPSVGLPIVDADNDGIDDSFDNCTTVANVEQLDRDGDGIGAACDWNDSPNSLPSVGSDDDTNPNDGGRGLPGAPSNP